MKPIAALICAAAMLWATATSAQQTQPAPAAAQEESYRPGLGDIMALQQMRHIKLWFAARAGNWPLADYEVGELNDGFEDVGHLLGDDIVKQHVGAPLAALQKAVDDKNTAAFTAAYDKLTAGCNACHHDLDHAFIAIERPASLPYSDQSFAAPK